MDQLDVGYGVDLSDVPACGGQGTPNRSLTSLDNGKFDRSLALGLALLGHVGLLGFVWDGTGARARSIASEAGDGSTITVDFVAISPRAPTPSLAALA